MSNLLIALLAYIIDKIFGEFRFIKHPIIIIGELISFAEKKLYNNTVLNGLLLVMFVLAVVTSISFLLEALLTALPYTLYILCSSFISAMFLAHKMLYDSVLELLSTQDKKTALAQLVSRDVATMEESDIYKAAIETYAENLSDGVIAPLFYLLLFSLPGIIIYKTINTMDSMLGYKNMRYEKFGKVAAKLDDVANFIPSRITAVLIMLLTQQQKPFAFYKDGQKHESPNAGHPITAMALFLGVALGGDTSYFGSIKKKPYFGTGGKIITASDLHKALTLRYKIDTAVIAIFGTVYLFLTLWVS